MRAGAKWSSQIRLSARLDEGLLTRLVRVRMKVWTVGNRQRGGRKEYGGDKVAFMASDKPPGRPGPATADYMDRPRDFDPDTGAVVVADGGIDRWSSDTPRTFVTVAPQLVHDMFETGKEIAAELTRRLGGDVQVHGVVHRHQGRDHWHFAIDRQVPAYKLERSVDAALVRRRERTRELSLEKRPELAREQGLER
jgi:hypothetical protein